jgi:hypothetical protein
MRAVLMTAAGGPEVLQVAELPDPEITGGRDVRVRLRAAGINPVDYKLRSAGTIGGTLPAVLGWDGAGVVESTGAAVTRVRPGDEVYFCDGGFGPAPGTYQEGDTGVRTLLVEARCPGAASARALSPGTRPCARSEARRAGLSASGRAGS